MSALSSIAGQYAAEAILDAGRVPYYGSSVNNIAAHGAGCEVLSLLGIDVYDGEVMVRLEPEVKADVVEALAAGSVVGEGALNLLPVARRVVHNGEVREFVNYDIVDEFGFCHYEAPVEANAAV